LENLALRQQLAVLTAKRLRPHLETRDRLFWIILRRFWSEWRRVLLIVHPETVVGWHRGGFKMYWKWISRRRIRSGRKPTPKALRELIFRLVVENSTWGAPRIHGELKMLGYEISGANCPALDAKGAQECRAGETLGSIPEQPP
jgi:hypothetical protein